MTLAPVATPEPTAYCFPRRRSRFDEENQEASECRHPSHRQEIRGQESYAAIPGTINHRRQQFPEGDETDPSNHQEKVKLITRRGRVFCRAPARRRNER